ncbi:uncharacterized protein A1O9_09588 [Exophiala aquamarina CBS 119918]|uniref:Enoyl reductase (ER) domain-containing protein n=1 Tax=Exophiala aquamarina CBS 119918 TaxID=1182545 RepID=A0A072P3J8_9EURO|nr:uncharacterized protein A1O9_09588 [Exophiala aquamarina CBS 119918]KEF54421.1 hypothetical protein A1O9_09588 [Exophiala aquamarina CBS 119918]
MANHAIIIKAAATPELVEASVPSLRDDYILVKVKAVALNPTDILHIDYFAPVGACVGCDYAGIVEEVGTKVTKPFKKGDRIAGVAHGSNAVNHEDGTFAELITVKGDLQIHIPDTISFEEAATLGIGITTVGQALYQSLGLALPEESDNSRQPLLVYGGSTATGSLAVQYAKQSGMLVVATASAHNFDYVKSLGADEVFDYTSPTCAEDIKRSTKGELTLALDCISKGNSTQICVEAMSDKGGVYTTLLPVPGERVTSINDKVENKSTLAYTAIGEAFQFGPQSLPAIPSHFEFAKKFWSVSERLLADGKIKVHQIAVNEGGSGLQGVLQGLQTVRTGDVRGRKLVYTL